MLNDIFNKNRIILPQSALEQLLAAAPLQEISSQQPLRRYTSSFDPFSSRTIAAESQPSEHNVHRQQQLPHPLTFRLVNTQNSRVIYAGIREFSARENEIGLSASLREALGISQEGGEADAPIVTVHAEQLPKGTYVRLRPLEAGYDTDDWKALLERHLRSNYTTLTTGETLTVPRGQEESFKFLVDKVEPQGEGICVVDTDLEVDIVALTEEQARETLHKRLARASRASKTNGGTSAGGVLDLGAEVTGQVLPGEYVDYELRKWEAGSTIEINLVGDDNADVTLLVSPLSARQRNRPRMDEHVFGELSSQTQKQISIAPTNAELDNAEALYITVHAFASADEVEQQASAKSYQLRLVSATSSPNHGSSESDEHDADDVLCKNCQRWVPSRTFVLHENFCFRNNVLCTQCRKVFQKRSPEWQNHWHCPYDASFGHDLASQHKHDLIFHTKRSCRACGFEAEGFQHLAQHRTTVCPAKPILCLFCHLEVPQQGESDPDMQDPEVLVSGLTPHELVDGGRTNECHLCNKIVRLRDMKTHLRHHDLDRLSRPTPQICLNQNCGRTLDGRGVQSTIKPGNDTIGLCSICFGPLYVDTYDPEGKVLHRRIERRYLSQLMKGCCKSWCQNEYCKTGKQNRHQLSDSAASMSAAAILSLVRPLIDAVGLQGKGPHTAPFYFCTDQAGQQRRNIAEILAAENHGTAGKKTYDLAWCVAAVEAAGSDLGKAREWLENWAPARGERLSYN
jgi:hypothetical protein